MPPRTLARRSYPRAGSSWVYPPDYARAAKELPDVVAKVDALVATVAEQGVDPEQLAAVGESLSALRALVDEQAQAATEQRDTLTTRADTLAADTAGLADGLAVERAARTQGDDDTATAAANAMQRANASMTRANNAMTVANIGRDFATTAAERLDALDAGMTEATTAMAGMPTMGVLEQAVAQAQADVRAAEQATREQAHTVTRAIAADALAAAITALRASCTARDDDLAAKLTALTGRVGAAETAQTTTSARVDAVVAQAAALVAGLAALTTRVDGIAAAATAMSGRLDALTAAQTTLTSRVDGIATNQGALSARLDTLTTRVDALAARHTYQVAGTALLPALAVNTPKDVDVPWDNTLPVAPHSVRIAGVDGITTLLTWSIKTVTATKAVVTITSPALLAASVGRVRVGGLYEGTS